MLSILSDFPSRNWITSEECILRLLLLFVRPCVPTYAAILERSHTTRSLALDADCSGLTTAHGVKNGNFCEAFVQAGML